MSFDKYQLPESLMRVLEELKFETPTKVQQKTMPLGLKGEDLIVCAETGSGKTAAYGIPILNHLFNKPESRALILAPTRELAHQISEFMRVLTTYFPKMFVTSIVGGADIHKQKKQLKRNPRVIVATPGRLTDHLKRKTLKLDDIHHLVLDEGDRMLDMGFAPQIDEILKYVPKSRQTMLFTATLPPKVKALGKKYLLDPKHIQIGEVSQPVKTVKQSVVQVTTKEKDHLIIDELNSRKGSVIVFLKTKRRTTSLAQHLLDYGFKVGLIHGGRTQGQRNKAIQSFRSGESRILCATDVAARGIDIPHVEHVINFDLPMMREDYVHRIGRTARNGAEGEALSFVTPHENREWQALAKQYSISGVELKVTSAKGKSFRKNSKDDHKRKSKSKSRFKKKSSSKSSFNSKGKSGGRPGFKSKKKNSSRGFKRA